LLLEWNSTCFGQFLCPSSGVFHCTHNSGICHTGLLTACEQDQNLFIYLFICLFIYLFIYLFACLFICLFVYLFLFIYLFIYLFVYLFIYLSNLSMDKLENLVHLVGFIIRNLSRCTVTWTSKNYCEWWNVRSANMCNSNSNSVSAEGCETWSLTPR